MLTTHIISKLKWHAGLISDYVAPPEQHALSALTSDANNDLAPAFDDFFRHLEVLNVELNGSVPSETSDPNDRLIGLGAVYAITEVMRMVKEWEEGQVGQNLHLELRHLSWQLDHAWQAILAGDVDDLRGDVRRTFAAKFGYGVDEVPPPLPYDMGAVIKIGHDPESGDDLAYILYEQGRSLMAKGQFPQALVALRRAFASGIHYSTLIAIGKCHIALGQHHPAVEPLAAATALNGKGQACAILAETFLKLDDIDAALDFALEALERNPGYRRAIAVLKAPAIQAHLQKLREDFVPEHFGPSHPLKRLNKLFPETGGPK